MRYKTPEERHAVLEAQRKKYAEIERLKKAKEEEVEREEQDEEDDEDFEMMFL